ncbi:CDP-diacylglycerol--glycerol-3-phosphate 3-phosphatidyltransferase [Motilibacter peucedani]|uniref:Phosphatidylinositol phosphate synthase n=1 Tax=Motilibacter peucedani TaxID=598650 RepID=A0A420XSB6_9ACTN|nr:CDP-diacylglycerol--glycerol-3-phosphate 3-phosphatidyltransferase [Motilibacter peucedani]
MLNKYARVAIARVMTPLARLLVRAGISPDIVTLLGTLGVCAGALGFFPRGELFWGTIVITCFVFSDVVDGTMARLSGRSSVWGAWLDSSTDRAGDAAIFGGIAVWGAHGGHDDWVAGLALYGLVAGSLVSYVKARAEGLGMRANVGIMERSDRLVTILVAAGLDGLGVPYVLAIALWAVAIGATLTVVQRTILVRSQAIALPGADAERAV